MEKITPASKKAYDLYNHKECKPDNHIQNIINALEPSAIKPAVLKSAPLNFSGSHQRLCTLLHKGHVDLCRQSDGLVLNTERAPFIFGLANLSITESRLILVPSPDTVISVIPLEKAFEITTQKNLWESVAHLLVYISNRIYEHCTRMSQINSYETVRTLLHELLEEPEEIRNSVSALHYIRSRSFLSRSGIMKILSELRMGAYIHLSAGKLMSINSLPKKF
ncbi:helix-turn-helix domain-containing protein [Enterobacter ludwigii]|nr:helix-turn-helix domain-containing protein [Enterobacter ludwigii]